MKEERGSTNRTRWRLFFIDGLLSVNIRPAEPGLPFHAPADEKLKSAIFAYSFHMAHGRKTGGRVAGTPNRRTEELVSRLEALGVDPVTGLAMIANDPTASLDLRARVQMELLGYMYPKRKALDVSTPAQQAVSIRIGIPAKDEAANTALEGTPE
jgi:hypothetical protein